MTTTPKLGLTLPADGTVPWGSIVNENFTLIDAAVSTVPSRQSVTFTLSGTTGVQRAQYATVAFDHFAGVGISPLQWFVKLNDFAMMAGYVRP